MSSVLAGLDPDVATAVETRPEPGSMRGG